MKSGGILEYFKSRKGRRLYVVGMPRSGSVYLYDLMESIRDMTGLFTINNECGGGTQHLEYSRCRRTLNENNQVIGVHRDLRDVVVSYHSYILKHHTIEDDVDSRQSKGYHSLYRDISGLPYSKAIDRLIEHPNCLVRCSNWFIGYWGQEHVRLLEFETLTSNEGPELLHKTLESLNISIDRDVVEEAFKKNSFEAKQAQNPVHFKDGRIGKYADRLTSEQINRIQSVYSEYYDKTGYLIE